MPKTFLYKAPIATNCSLVTDGSRKKSPKMLGSFALSRLRPFSEAQIHIGCTQRVPKPDMDKMEGLELYLGHEGIM